MSSRLWQNIQLCNPEIIDLVWILEPAVGLELSQAQRDGAVEYKSHSAVVLESWEEQDGPRAQVSDWTFPHSAGRRFGDGQVAQRRAEILRLSATVGNSLRQAERHVEAQHVVVPYQENVVPGDRVDGAQHLEKNCNLGWNETNVLLLP